MCTQLLFLFAKVFLALENPYQSMYCVGGGGALPSPYPTPILTLPRLPSIPSLPPLPHPKKVCSFFFVFFQPRYKTRRKDIWNTAFTILPKMRKNLLLVIKFCTEQKLVTNEYAITLFAPVSVQKSVIAC